MTHIKLEHIDNLRRGKKSGARIGSRKIPHHLYAYEQHKYERALKYRYLEINSKDRPNLENLWFQLCKIKGWKNLVLIKNQSLGESRIVFDGKVIVEGPTESMKKEIKDMLNK